MSKPKMAVVRAFPRIPEFGFYTKFSKFDIKLIGNTPSIDEYFKKNFPKVESVCLRLKPAWIIDPVKILFKDCGEESTKRSLLQLQLYRRLVNLSSPQ